MTMGVYVDDMNEFARTIDEDEESDRPRSANDFEGWPANLTWIQSPRFANPANGHEVFSIQWILSPRRG